MRLMKTFGPAAPVSRSSDAREIPVGRAIVPAGSVIRGVVSAVTKAGRIDGAALGLRNIEIIGRSGPEYARMFERLASLEDPRDCQRQKTSEVYSRYAIVDEATISEAASTVNRGAKVRRISARRTAPSARPSAAC